MPNNRNRNILLPTVPQGLDYSYPGSGRDSRSYPTSRTRQSHGQDLLNNIHQLDQNIETQKRARTGAIDSDAQGTFIEVRGEAGFELKIDSLEDARAGIEVVSTKINEDSSRSAIVYVPDDKLGKVTKKIEDYLNPSKETRTGKPKNAPLVNSISEFRLALLKSFWMDKEVDYPTDDNLVVAWEVWVIKKRNSIDRFGYFCELFEISKKSHSIDFGDRVVFIITCSANTLSNIFNYDCPIGELRQITDTAFPIVDSGHIDQKEWARSILDRVQRNDSNVEIWLLDTGVNLTNPLLEGQIEEDKCIAVKNDWGTHDHEQGGHGTQMAGLALYGDVLGLALSNSNINISHKVASVKILPSEEENTPESYPHITDEAISKAIILSPNAKKIYNLTITSTDEKRSGIGNTTWSSAIDNICYQNKELFVISVGNIRDNQSLFDYPDSNLLHKAEDPSQSSNAIAVGAYTTKYHIDEEDYAGYHPLAEPNRLAPTSRTSRNWESFLPYKPDIVMEGGNRAISPDRTEIIDPDSLQILTTSSNPLQGTFTVTKDTSPATTLASNFLARLQVEFSEYWAETIRALAVHSASWTERMLLDFEQQDGQREYIKNILKRYGYGVPCFEKAVYCANNELTLVYQGEITPYELDGSKVKYKEMHLHELPWPSEELETLGETPVTMKVTLSYFVEPNPPRRGWIKKYGYSSHGLRFRMKTATESVEEFKARVSRHFREDDESYANSEASNWFIGTSNRSKGSLHSDIWSGTAVELAQKNYLIIHPTKGWWAELKSRASYNNRSRYALVVSIEVPEVNVDIYNSVKVKIDNIVENQIANLI